MRLRASFTKRSFQFNFKARTSRGLMNDKISWFVRLWNAKDPDVYGLGECSPLPGLSPEISTDFEEVLANTLATFTASDHTIDDSILRALPDLDHFVPSGFSSLTFGLETALLDLLNGGKRIIFDNDFRMGKAIPINGLVWMGDMDFMVNQIDQKIALGFQCIKLKVGGLDFDRECEILDYIRKRYSHEDIIIRLDANGTFKIDDALLRLCHLSRYDIHSIEQPIMPGSDAMEELCRKSPIPIAFDEELIGKESKEDKVKLLERMKPPFIILKPTLHGGLKSCAAWIEIAESFGIGWWITSALETNIGLNAICQFTSNYSTNLFQGLGTGNIYENNIAAPLRVDKGNILFDPSLHWNLKGL